jgi:predicted ATPase
MQSRSLLSRSKTFVGRQKQLEDLTEYISFSNDDFRIVNVVGAPGIGKTTLAIRVGHKMIASGVTVHYIDIAEFPDEQVQQVLATRVLESAQIVTDKVGDFRRLLKWARDCYWYNLLILDNCDDALNNQKESFQKAIERIVKESVNVKILMTSREIFLHLDYLKQCKIDELSLESACDLLVEQVPVEVKLTSENREAIANLTGKIPLALQIIASLLTSPSAPSPEDIIQELKKHPIETLSHDKLPENRQINVSFSLSYKYLSKELQIIGIYIAYFPGSFTQEAAAYSIAHLLHGIPYEHPEDAVVSGLRSLVEQSLLEHDARSQKERFHYHRLIREFFHIQNRDYENKLENFLSGFHHFYSIKLYAAAILFNGYHKPSLAFLDTERHNIQLLLHNLASQKINQREEFIAIITALAIALDTDFLTCRFTREELLEPLKNGLTHLDKHVKKYMTQLSPGPWPVKFDCDYEPQISFTSHRLVCTYETLIHNVAEIVNQIHGSEFALRVYGDRKDIMESIKQPQNTEPYLDFMERLAHYYQIEGFKDEEIECYKRINEHRQIFTEIICKEEKCRYVDVARMHVSLGNDEEAANFYELSLSKEKHRVLQKVEIFCELCEIYKRLHHYDKAEEFSEKLLLMHSEIMNASASQIFRYNDVVWNVIYLYKRRYLYFEAAMLEQKVLESLSDIGAIPDEQTLMTGVDTVRRLFHDRNYKESIQLGQQILQALAHNNNDMMKAIGTAESDVAKQEIQILIGRGKFHNGDLSAGLDDLESALAAVANVKAHTNLICKYLIFRPSLYFSSCSALKIRPYAIFKFGQTLGYLMLVPPVALTSEAKYLLDRPRQPLARSTVKDIVAVESELKIWDFFGQFQFHTTIQQLIHGYALGIIGFCVKSVLLRLVINLASYLLRLWILYILCKFILKLSRFANKYRCICLLITTYFSLFLCLSLVVLVFPLYLLYLRRLN